MHTILLTGFEPFDGAARNPAGDVARALDGAHPLAGAAASACRVRAAVLPVARDAAAERLRELLAEVRPAAVVALGMAQGRSVIEVEQVAVNLDDYRIPDAAGLRPQGEPIEPGGPDGLFATLPVRELVAAIRGVGVPARISRSAGTYICNHVFYRLLRWSAGPSPAARAVFIHVPALPETVATAGTDHPSMALATVTEGIRAALACVAQVLRRAAEPDTGAA